MSSVDSCFMPVAMFILKVWPDNSVHVPREKRTSMLPQIITFMSPEHSLKKNIHAGQDDNNVHEYSSFFLKVDAVAQVLFINETQLETVFLSTLSVEQPKTTVLKSIKRGKCFLETRASKKVPQPEASVKSFLAEQNTGRQTTAYFFSMSVAGSSASFNNDQSKVNSDRV